MKQAIIKRLEAELSRRFESNPFKTAGSDQKPAEFVPSGLAEIDSRIGGLQRGAITEISGDASAGKTSMIFSAITEASGRQECSAIVDATDSFDPVSGQQSGIDLEFVLWIRCGGKMESALKAADFLLHAGGFGVVALDLGDIRPDLVRRSPASYWFRFRLALENTATVLLLNTPIPCSGSSCCASLEFTKKGISWTGSPDYLLLRNLGFQVGFRRAGTKTTGRDLRAIL